MRSPFLSVAVLAVRWWTQFYTWGLPPAIQNDRRAEISSDLWHAIHDCENACDWRLGLHITLRLFLGIPDDLSWRVERHVIDRLAIGTLLTGAIVVGLIAAGASAWLDVSAPPMPSAPPFRAAVHFTSPPPPPAPPDAWHNETADPAVFEPAYGDTTYTITGRGRAPARIREVRPVYPPILRAASVEGVVILQATITEAGRVTDLRAEPSGLLAQSAIAAIQQWQFEPLGQNSASTPTVLTVSVRFVRPESVSSRDRLQ